MGRYPALLHDEASQAVDFTYKARWYDSCKIVIRVMYRVMAVVFCLSYGCHFDPSTGTASDAGSAGPNGDSTTGDCAGLEGDFCGDCGRIVCVNGPGGPQVFCQPDPAAPICSNGQACNGEGLCQSQIACSPGLSRTCGECGSESCIAGTWSGECVADDRACDTGTLCLPDAWQGGSLQCQAACSTEGHQTPYDPSGTGLNTGGDAGSIDHVPMPGGPIPEVVSIGVTWSSLDGCESEGGFKSCTCSYNPSSNTPEVDCENFCRSTDG